MFFKGKAEHTPDAQKKVHEEISRILRQHAPKRQRL